MYMCAKRAFFERQRERERERERCLYMSICVPKVYYIIERGTERWLCTSICVQNVCVTEIHLSMSLTHT